MEALTFYGFYCQFMVPLFPKTTGDETTMIQTLIKKLEDCEEKDIIELTDKEHEALVQALPKNIPGLLQVTLIRFYHAVTSASHEDPNLKESS